MENKAIYSRQYDVVVIGGGTSGAGTARDCALRGLTVLLVERDDWATGATGRNHGLLHSGARYAVTDNASAAECYAENLILRRIANHCVEPTEGLFVSLPGDDPDYRLDFVKACRAAGIPAVEIAPDEALRLEPALNPQLTGAITVPDAAVDPFRLTAANVMDACRHGAVALTRHEVTAIRVAQNTVAGVTLLNRDSGTTVNVDARAVVNAAGIWGQRLLLTAGITLTMFPAKGAMLIYGQRVNHRVINRCRRPADGDILVPDGNVTIMGTTSERIDMAHIDDMRVTDREVDLLMAAATQLAPALASTRLLRAYAGVRPLVADDNDPAGRDISRGIVCLDHGARDGLNGLFTVTGGKLMTYRLMACRVTDAVCCYLHVDVPCATHRLLLPGAVEHPDDEPPRLSHALRGAYLRHGALTTHINVDSVADRAMVCECKNVSVGELRYAIGQLGATSLDSLRRYTRLGMGTCQGKICACRAANILAATGSEQQAIDDLRRFVAERWSGMKPVAWGNTLREAHLTAAIYRGLCGLDRITPHTGGEARHHAL